MAGFKKQQSDIQPRPKNTRQGFGKHTKYSASSRNGAKKPMRGQGK